MFLNLDASIRGADARSAAENNTMASGRSSPVEAGQSTRCAGVTSAAANAVEADEFRVFGGQGCSSSRVDAPASSFSDIERRSIAR
jgi:hypothetical protein